MPAEPESRRRVAFVIPSFNEEANIVATLQSITAGGFAASDITVVDNDSRDRTAELARSAGANVLVHTGGTIGSNRNHGVAQTRSDVLVFLDADVTLTPEWHTRFAAVLESLDRDPAIITGSHCSVPDEDGILMRYWFAAIEHSSSSHLGSGHLVMTRQLFDRVGGFNTELVTGEDYDLCRRAVAAGARIVEDPALKVFHNDYPRSVVAFVAREAWHGLGDVRSIAAAFASRVFVAALVYAALLAALIGLLSARQWPLAALVGAGLLVFLLFLSRRKFRGRPPQHVVVNAGVFALYLSGRLLSLPLRLWRAIGKSA